MRLGDPEELLRALTDRSLRRRPLAHHHLHVAELETPPHDDGRCGVLSFVQGEVWPFLRVKAKAPFLHLPKREPQKERVKGAAFAPQCGTRLVAAGGDSVADALFP